VFFAAVTVVTAGSMSIPDGTGFISVIESVEPLLPDRR
jgi:hypothetical protein